jgi:hypothetical protein
LHRVADRDRAVAEDVGTQAAAMYERAQHRAIGVARNDAAGLAQAHSPAAHSSHHELVANERVEVDPPGDDVAPVLT